MILGTVIWKIVHPISRRRKAAAVMAAAMGRRSKGPPMRVARPVSMR
jgi:hypothetical protein